ncbi:hypothetical protein [Nocardia farcinica]|uniref:hypothetical protein n=1 Tax=Nocardia farcinica TaxID=37329 RepID=UPI002457F997|nr:hypothetical protein [Nocardia farcinica]
MLLGGHTPPPPPPAPPPPRPAARAAVDQQVHDIEYPPSRAESLRRLAAQAGIDLDDE